MSAARCLIVRAATAGRTTAWLVVLAWASVFTSHVSAQDVSNDPATTGADASVSIDLNRAAGQVWWQVTPVVEYTFDPRWSVEAGVPLYYLTAGSTEEGTAQGGVGDVYVSASLTSSTARRVIYTTLTLSAPTGSVDKGLGAGQASWDWTGSVSGQAGRVAPYVNGGVGNNTKTASETLGTSSGTALAGAGISVGMLGHLEAGIESTLAKSLTLTASVYGIFASGDVSDSSGRSVSDHGVGFVLWDHVTPSLDLSLWVSHSLAFADYTAVSVNATMNLHRRRRIHH